MLIYKGFKIFVANLAIKNKITILWMETLYGFSLNELLR